MIETEVQQMTQEVAMKHPGLGEIVHYVLDSGPNSGQCRAAIIVRVVGDGERANVNIFADGQGDGITRLEGSVGYVRRALHADGTAESMIGKPPRSFHRLSSCFA